MSETERRLARIEATVEALLEAALTTPPGNVHARRASNCWNAPWDSHTPSPLPATREEQ